MGRFINADEPTPLRVFKMVLITNLYAYSDNDAVGNCDIDGYFTLKSIFKKIKNIITIRWSGVSIKLSRKISIVFGILTLIYRVFWIVSDIRSIKKLLNNKMATAIVAALPYGTSIVSFEIIAWLCNVGAVVAVLSAILSFFASSCTGGVFEIAKTAILFVISYVAPTMISAIQMLYYGFKKKRGCTYTVKFLGGSTVSFK